MMVYGLDYVQSQPESDGYLFKLVANEAAVFFFTHTTEHRDAKQPGLSYEGESAGNALAAMVKPGRIEFLKSAPKPGDIAREVYRLGMRIGEFTLLNGPVTFTHADRITDFTCDVEGDVAKGTVSFKVPDLYQDKVDYVAKRKDDK